MQRLQKKLDRVNAKLKDVEQQLIDIGRTHPQENYRCWIKDDPVQNQINHQFWTLWPKRITYIGIRSNLLQQIHQIENKKKNEDSVVGPALCEYQE